MVDDKKLDKIVEELVIQLGEYDLGIVNELYVCNRMVNDLLKEF